MTESLGHKEDEGKLFYELDWEFIEQMAQRMQSNKSNGKYERWNWMRPIDPEKLKQPSIRHMVEIMKGNYEDDGRPYGHLEALACNMMMLSRALKNKDQI